MAVKQTGRRTYKTQGKNVDMDPLRKRNELTYKLAMPKVMLEVMN